MTLLGTYELFNVQKIGAESVTSGRNSDHRLIEMKDFRGHLGHSSNHCRNHLSTRWGKTPGGVSMVCRVTTQTPSAPIRKKLTSSILPFIQMAPLWFFSTSMSYHFQLNGPLQACLRFVPLHLILVPGLPKLPPRWPSSPPFVFSNCPPHQLKINFLKTVFTKLFTCPDDHNDSQTATEWNVNSFEDTSHIRSTNS